MYFTLNVLKHYPEHSPHGLYAHRDPQHTKSQELLLRGAQMVRPLFQQPEAKDGQRTLVSGKNNMAE